ALDRDTKGFGRLRDDGALLGTVNSSAALVVAGVVLAIGNAELARRCTSAVPRGEHPACPLQRLSRPKNERLVGVPVWIHSSVHPVTNQGDGVVCQGLRDDRHQVCRRVHLVRPRLQLGEVALEGDGHQKVKLSRLGELSTALPLSTTSGEL